MAVEFELDETLLKSNDFEMEWPPKSGKLANFPEVDRGEWFQTHDALKKINPAQADFIVQMISKISASLGTFPFIFTISSTTTAGVDKILYSIIC